MDSRYTLRFPRTYREATGQDAHFDKANPDRWVGWAVLLVCVFVAGLLVGSASC